MIRVKKINKYFNKGKNNELHVLNDINLEFENNGLVVILGESGSGKNNAFKYDRQDLMCLLTVR